jgi:outer membrane protein assembly factor BamE (lipoprotein component of BamABCDE complex)
VQGNVVTRNRPRVKPGRRRAQVRDILGTPLLTDPFHADRWDYLFTLAATACRRSAAASWSGSKVTCSSHRGARPAVGTRVRAAISVARKKASRRCWN